MFVTLCQNNFNTYFLQTSSFAAGMPLSRRNTSIAYQPKSVKALAGAEYVIPSYSFGVSDFAW